MVNLAARVTVDTAALKHNLRVVRDRAPGARVMAVIKANAYGHGLVAAARALADAEAFAVARLEEAVSLRNAGLSNRIVLLEGVFHPDQLPRASALGLDVVVHSPGQLAMLEAADLPEPVSVWLKVDTGMNRLGVRPGDAGDAVRRLAACASVAAPVRFMTHLACADERDGVFTDRQLQVFDEALAGLEGERSIANSAGLLWRADARADWVRPGIMLYGASPFSGGAGRDLGLKPVMRLASSVISVKDVRAGERVGYGGTWEAPRDARIAIAAIGYGDGYTRHLGSGTPVMIRGETRPLAGRVSMDMIAVDITDAPAVRVGDEVVLWGEGIAVEELARRAGTIPYELLCGVTQRVAVTVV
ncbi:MAG: alanine racemase [Gammaproteobacteria bacterium]